MCYRFSNVQEESDFRRAVKNVLSGFSTTLSKGKRFLFYHSNGFAHEQLPVISQENPNDLTWMYWGLIPSGVKSKADKEKYWKMGYTLNARSEEIFQTWSFKNAVKDKRCLIPATGFFEWREFNKKKYPYLIQVKSSVFPDDVEPFCFAGVYDRWVDESTGEIIEGFAIITTEANEMMKQIHVNLSRPDGGSRMPVIIHQSEYLKWLNPLATFEDLTEIMMPFDENAMQAYTISKDITSKGAEPNKPETLNFHPFDELSTTTEFNL